MDLIERQAAIDAILGLWDWETVDGITTTAVLKQTIIDLKNIPRVEVEPVIRCKDCVHYKGHWYCEAWNNSPGFPAVKEDGFCNMAERRDDGTE